MAQHILSALDAVLPTQQTWRLQVLQQWPQIIGNLAGKVKLHQINSSSVVLSVTHPSLAHELLMLSDLIREKINAVIGQDLIKAIHFRTQYRQKQRAKTHRPAQEKRIQPAAPLNALEQKILATVENEELRAALSSFYQTCKQRSRS